MRYILDESDGPIDFDRYLNYLQTIRDRLPAAVYRFASDSANFDLSSHCSLHDAWLEHFNITEPAEGARNELRRIDIKSSYLGPFHDKRILINYIDVIGYSIQTPSTFLGPPSYRTGHGDLITHEIRLDDDNRLEHELCFSRGSVITVCFKGFAHEVQDV
ncbi:MAG: hypothetical protein ACREUW_20310 [Burkholderiales bacterium]